MDDIKKEGQLLIDPATFCGDAKAFFARLITLGWVVRMRVRTGGNPLQESYSGSIKDARIVVPLFYQLSRRPILELVEDYFRGPQLSYQAFHSMRSTSIKASTQAFRMMLFDYGAEMNADFHTVLEWFEDRSVLSENDGKDLQSPFLKMPIWSFQVRWAHCSLEYRSYQPHEDDINRVICHQVAGDWRPFGYVHRQKSDLGPDEFKIMVDGRPTVVPATPTPGPLERDACVCNKAIDLHAALLAFKPWENYAESLLGSHIQRLRKRLGISTYDLYESLAGLFTDFVFWHECGHIHNDPMERALCQSLVCESFFHERYGYDYTELNAERYAIAKCVDSCGPEMRCLYQTFFLYEDASFDRFSLCELIKIRSLQEPVPSDYIEDFMVKSIEKMRLASREIEQRLTRQRIAKDNPMWRSSVREEMKNGDCFTNWQARVEISVRKEVASWLEI